MWNQSGWTALRFVKSFHLRSEEASSLLNLKKCSGFLSEMFDTISEPSCSHYRGIKLMSHTGKIWERVVGARLGREVMISKQHCDLNIHLVAIRKKKILKLVNFMCNFKTLFCFCSL